jgi:DNA-binding NarL/FixJ family response regulator
MKVIRVYVVDDESLVRTGLRLRLGVEPDIEVVGEAADGERALQGIAEVRPAVVLMDVHLPGIDGIAATLAVRASVPDCAVVMLSLQDDAETRTRARLAGACAFVAKHEVDAALTDAIRKAAACAARGGGD